MSTNEGQDLIKRRHPENVEFSIRWQWLLHSLEGGEIYRNASYGSDPVYGLPIRNLVRHKREYPDPKTPSGGMAIQAGNGSDQYSMAATDDYELRRARTPVPTLTQEAVELHLARIYSKDPARKGPDEILAWWKDVDGKGTTIASWMPDTIAPLLLVLGQLDVIFGHPEAPKGMAVKTRQDQEELRLDGVIASYILPQNMLWWELDQRGRYVECLVQEWDCGKARYRHWTPQAWVLYESDGKKIGEDGHPFGRPPIIRIFDRKRPRLTHTGMSRYESIAEIQREVYNRDSELILSDTQQAHPIIQAPQEAILADSEISIGPGYTLPKVKTVVGTSVHYEGWECLNFPKEAAQSLRENIAGLIDRADRAAMRTKPAGVSGTSAGTVAQSGIAKRLDNEAGNDVLSKISAKLASAEIVMAEMALLVLGNGIIDPRAREEIEVVYPKKFDLFTADELADAIVKVQGILANGGEAPLTEFRLASQLVRQLIPGLDDDEYRAIDDEIRTLMEAKAQGRRQAAESMPISGLDRVGENETPPDAGEDQGEGAPGIGGGESEGVGPSEEPVAGMQGEDE